MSSLGRSVYSEGTFDAEVQQQLLQQVLYLCNCTEPDSGPCRLCHWPQKCRLCRLLSCLYWCMGQRVGLCWTHIKPLCLCFWWCVSSPFLSAIPFLVHFFCQCARHVLRTIDWEARGSGVMLICVECQTADCHKSCCLVESKVHTV